VFHGLPAPAESAAAMAAELLGGGGITATVTAPGGRWALVLGLPMVDAQAPGVNSLRKRIFCAMQLVK